MAQIVGYFSNGSPIYKDDLTQKSVFINCDFRHSDLSELDLKSLKFFQCDFTMASFRESKFTDLEFRACVLDYINALSTHFIGVVFIDVSMKGSLLTKAKFLITDWFSVEITGSKIFDLDMQETEDSGSCILGFQKDVIGQPTQLLDGYFTVDEDEDTPMAALLGRRTLKRITNSVIEEEISKSKKISKSLFRFLSRILGLRTVNYNNEYMRNSDYEWLQKRLEKSRKT